MSKQVPLGSDIQAGEGEKMAFLKSQLKAAAKLGSYLTVRNLADVWLELRGRADIDYKERARLHSNLGERLRKLGERGLAIRREAVARYHGQLASGWSWIGAAIDADDMTSDY
jgi:hypothetical protein